VRRRDLSNIFNRFGKLASINRENAHHGTKIAKIPGIYLTPLKRGFKKHEQGRTIR
jgi:hypothetical protein